jgi:cleavage stimulation factor subunit 3
MHRINKDAGVARNVFDMGLKQHGSELNYVLSYVDFLMTLNDDNNTRY